ncbi:MAG: methylenetetrahydrofolate reductase [NAD(P)H] [Bacteroidetes bacterium GWF2_33_16]|nr:MAG: methylenetetrahydrofolate reductase [NAD(P)H] [Bacteroidetes bacterium GWE2_32_14]OFY03911.1 MAG: methylenetetrahydrofolate reductase [NAD(P)H] [Bacteroidetes bacterium GWF2_33_16]
MKVIDKIKNSKKPLFTFELLPPLKGHTIQEIYNTIDPLIEFNPAYINITYHQQEVIYKTRPDGLMEKRVIRKRPGTVAIAAAIQNKYKITVVPHMICGGFTKEETEDALIDFQFLGIDNLLALRGDPPKGARQFIAEPGGHSHSSELIEQIMNLNKGIYLNEDLVDAMPTDFSVGIAGYPEKHVEAPNLESDLEYLKLKVDKGADYIVTQLFYDNQTFYSFVDKCRKIGIDVPIIPGIKPVSTLNDISLLPQTFHIDLPNDLVQEIKKCKSNKEVRVVGVEWAIEQSKQLIKYGAPGIHYYTLDQSDNVKKIAQAIF